MTVITPTDYDTSSVRVSKSIRDNLWELNMEIASTGTPQAFENCQVKFRDHNETEYLRFLGTVPGSRYRLQHVNNHSTVIGYDQAWFLTKQYLIPEQLNIGLDDNSGWNDWDDVVEDLLNETGIESYRLRNPGSYSDEYYDKRFSFQPGTTKMQAINEIAKACNFVFEVKPRWDGAEWISSAYFVNITELDDPDKGLDLPAPVQFAHPDPHIIDVPVIDDTGDNRYNRFIVRGHDSQGNWFTATEESANVTDGTAIPRELYEESPQYNTQAKCDARVVELYSLYNLVVKTMTVRLKHRYDLELYQLIKFSGYASCLDISEEYYRILSITYDHRPDDDIVTIQCTPDRLDKRTWYEGGEVADIIDETEAVAEHVNHKTPGAEPGDVTSVNGSTINVQLERGGIVQARAIGVEPQAGDKVFVQSQKDGSRVISGGSGGGWTSPAESDLDMQAFKIKSTTSDVRIEASAGNKIIFSRADPQ